MDGPRGFVKLFEKRRIAGVLKAGSKFWPIKLKKAVSWAYRVCLVTCFVPWLILVRKDKISSEVREVNSLSPKSEVNRERIE